MDPGNEYLVDWLWGYTTVGINVDKVKQALGTADLQNAWDLVFNPEYVSKLKKCGVAILDSASEVLPIALNYIGKILTAKIRLRDYAEAGKMLKTGSATCDALCRVGLGLHRSDGQGQALCRAGLVWRHHDCLKPCGGEQDEAECQSACAQVRWFAVFDVMAIPKDAKNVENAHKWIDYIMRPEVHASLTNTVFYANPNKASLKYVKDSIAKNEAVFPSAGILSSMLSPGVPDQATRRIITRTFTNFKSNR